MQAIESQTLILYHTDLRGEWPQAGGRALAARLRYGKRLATGGDRPAVRATLAGIALALCALTRLTGRIVAASELVFARGEKPRIASAAAGHPDFSISHSGPWVGCAAVTHGRVGFDVEMGSGERIERWVAREAVLKGCGAGLAALRQVRLAAAQASCRGERWYAHAAQVFPGAAACLMTSLAGQQLSARALSLEELFAP